MEAEPQSCPRLCSHHGHRLSFNSHHRLSSGHKRTQWKNDGGWLNPGHPHFFSHRWEPCPLGGMWGVEDPGERHLLRTTMVACILRFPTQEKPLQLQPEPNEVSRAVFCFLLLVEVIVFCRKINWQLNFWKSVWNSYKLCLIVLQDWVHNVIIPSAN